MSSYKIFVQISVHVDDIGYLEEHFPFHMCNSDCQSDLEIVTSLTCNLKKSVWQMSARNCKSEVMSLFYTRNGILL